jgi:hypothetical protein
MGRGGIEGRIAAAAVDLGQNREREQMPESGAARALRGDEDDFFRESSPSLRLVEAQEAETAPDWLLDPGQRRTVKITGQATPPRQRRTVTEHRIRARPDRIALWAFFLGLFLVFVAVATANAAPL